MHASTLVDEQVRPNFTPSNTHIFISNNLNIGGNRLIDDNEDSNQLESSIANSHMKQLMSNGCFDGNGEQSGGTDDSNQEDEDGNNKAKLNNRKRPNNIRTKAREAKFFIQVNHSSFAPLQIRYSVSE